MPYTFQYLNPLRQFGRVEYDLLLTDFDGVMPDVRLQKSFPDSVSGDVIAEAANADIAAYTKQYQDAQTRVWLDAYRFGGYRYNTKELPRNSNAWGTRV